MNPLKKEEAKKTMNGLGRAGKPFLFIISFEMAENYVIPLADVNREVIRYSVPGHTNSDPLTPGSSIERFGLKPPAAERYREAFILVQEEIKKGNTYLLNLTFPTELVTLHTLAELYDASRAPYKLLFRDAFLVFSPETFVKIQQGSISAFPMKGTIDAALPDAEKMILGDLKETSEHYTIVDLIRNDLSSVAERVRVKRFRYIDRITTTHKQLLQVSSEICGELPQDYPASIGDIVFGLLPAGSVTGAPKKKTLEIINRVEGYNRGFYTGVFGCFDGKDLDSAVMIRFIDRGPGGKLFYKSGGGITAFSDDAMEYQELIDKVYVPVD
jgi:para-aminobenzoate synthetase component 1